MDLERGRSLTRRQLSSPAARALYHTGRFISHYGTTPAAATAYAYALRSRSTDSGYPTPPSAKRMRRASFSRTRSRGRSRSRTTSRRRSSSSRRTRYGSITTEQRDSSTRYVSRGRRRPSRFVRRVQNVMLRMGPVQTFSLRFGGLKSVPVNQQVWEGQMLGGTQPQNNDEIFQAFRNAYGTGVTVSNVDSYRLFIKSLCLDIQISNTGDKNLIIEMYTLRSRKAWTAADRLPVVLSTSISELDTPTGFTFTSTDPGYTLFQVPQFCQYWSTLRKQQIVISAGETTTLQIRMPINRMINGKYIETHSHSLANAKAFMWSTKGSPESTGGSEPGAQYSDGQYVWTSQTTVNYQIPPGTSIQRSATQI